MRKAFTLIELLVVIAIIALLLAIIMPSLKTAKKLAQGAVCLHNLRGLSMSYYLYAQDNNDKLVKAGARGGGWVERPQDNNGNTTDHDSTVREKEIGIMKGTLFPYAETVKLYHCPGDKRYRVSVNTRGKGPYRSYAIPAGANSPNGTDDWSDAGINIGSHRFRPIRKCTDIVSPGDKYIFVEENYTHVGGTNTALSPDAGYNTNVWSFWKDEIYTSWWDPLAPWHNDRTNLAYADGHAEKLVWKDARTVKFAHDRWSVPYNQPNNPDQEYMSRAYPCMR